MFSDEGVGVHLVKLLSQKYKFKSNEHSVDFMDGGTLAMYLMHIMVEYDRILLIDCLDASNGTVGDVYFFNYEVMPKSISWSGSAHEIEMLQTLQMLDLSGDRPLTQILGVIPKRIVPMNFKLSDEILKASKTIEKKAVSFLHDLGFECKIVEPNLTLQDIADEFDKKGKK